MSNIIDTIFTILSVLLNVIFVIPKSYKWITDKRYLYAILSSKNEYFGITQSRFKSGTIFRSSYPDYTLLTENSVISIQKIVELLMKVNIKYAMIDTIKDLHDEIHIGGPISNVATNSYIIEYFTNLKFVDKLSKEKQHKEFYNINRDMIEYSDDFHGFVVEIKDGIDTKRKLFPVNRQIDYMFLIKLTSSDLKCDKTVHLLFGGTDAGTLAAVDFFTKYYKELYRRVKDKHYFFVVQLHMTSQIPATSEIIDLTEGMFKD